MKKRAETRRERRSLLPHLSGTASSHQYYRKDIQLNNAGDNENRLDGWGAYTPEEEEDIKPGISEYARRWEMRNYYSERTRMKG